MKEQKMKRSDIKMLALVIDKILSRKELINCIKFHYALVRNLKVLTPIVTNFDTVTSEKLVDYRKDGKEAGDNFVELDDKGNKVYMQGQPKIDPAKMEDFEKVITEIEEKHKDALQSAKDFMQEDEAIKLFKIKLSNVPEGITGEELFGIDVLVEEDSTDK